LFITGRKSTNLSPVGTNRDVSIAISLVFFKLH